MAERAVLGLGGSREFMIFKAFAGNDSFLMALKELQGYDAEHPDRKIIGALAEKEVLQNGFKAFKEAEKKLCRNGAPDYDDPKILKRLATILSQESKNAARAGLGEQAGGSLASLRVNAVMKAIQYGRDVKTLGRRLLKNEGIKHEQARVAKSGITGHSPYEKVVSEEKNYKSNEEIILERMLKER